ncbi:MAG: Rne/Rng family ribonuclease [Fimbriimonadaceae bacterium]|nr:Rne/Rng family ribonuclease [Fimbriimonadaceae bacterium]
MSRQILISSGIFETRMAILEDGALQDFYAERGSKIIGNVYKGRVENVLPGMDAAFVDIGLPKNAFLYVDNVVLPGESRAQRSKQRSISELLRRGQEVVVQVERAAVGTKGPRATSKLSLPGRFVVMIGPESRHIGVSRRIPDSSERNRLRRLGEKYQPADRALIMRTEAEGATEDEIRQDIEYLVELYDKIAEKARKTHAPALLHQDFSMVYRVCRDFFTADVEKLVVDSQADYDYIQEIMGRLDKSMCARVELHQSPEPLFVLYGIERDLDTALQRNVMLKSGGNLTIDETEALTVVDVNTGRFVGSKGLSDTILTTNLEAADEIARQMRLRDIGGIIIVDFIDMDRTRDRIKVYHELEKALERDRARTKIVHISPLALVEITRKRTGESLAHEISEVCGSCRGRGYILSPITIAIQAENQVRELAYQKRHEAFLVECQAEVADLLVGPGGETAQSLEDKLGAPVYVRVHDGGRDQLYISGGSREDIEGRIGWVQADELIKILPRDCFESETNHLVAIIDGMMIGLPDGARVQQRGAQIRVAGVERWLAFAEFLPTGKK